MDVARVGVRPAGSPLSPYGHGRGGGRSRHGRRRVVDEACDRSDVGQCGGAGDTRVERGDRAGQGVQNKLAHRLPFTTGSWVCGDLPTIQCGAPTGHHASVMVAKRLPQVKLGYSVNNMATMPPPIVLAGGRVLDPARGFDGVADVLIMDGRI